MRGKSACILTIEYGRWSVLSELRQYPEADAGKFTGPEQQYRVVRVAVLWKRPAGYLDACLHELNQRRDVEVFFASFPVAADAPYQRSAHDWLDETHVVTSPGEDAQLEQRLDSFAPDVILISGWEVPIYRRVARRFGGRSLRVLCMDNPWRRTIRQIGGVALSRVGYLSMFDRVFLPGERQRNFARRLGFESETIRDGLYCADVDLFSSAPTLHGDLSGRRQFVAAARLAPEKAIDVLLEAYAIYRTLDDDPWSLVLAGTGPLRLPGFEQPGVETCGFLEPHELCELFGRSGCFVLPSRFEPWGVAVHEAAAAGLPIVCSSAVGASDSFVVHGMNGLVVEPGDATALAHALREVATATADDLVRWSERSRELGLRVNPEQWADTVIALANPDAS